VKLTARLFPATLTFDDPAVADEFVGPVISRDKHPGPVQGKVLDTTVGASLTRLLLPEFAIMADSNWTEHDRKGLRSETGFGPTHLFSSALALLDHDPTALNVLEGRRRPSTAQVHHPPQL
jgi:hypothetical protein